MNCKDLERDNRGVFGLDSVKVFFAILLGLALLAYVIVVIMGTLSNSELVPIHTLSGGATFNESGNINQSGYSLQNRTLEGYTPSITYVYNTSVEITSDKWRISSGIMYNATATTYNLVNVSYTYKYDDNAAIGARNALRNTSGGVTSFFSAINPVFAILAILVIILILVVLVRVVTSSSGGGGASQSSSVL